MLGFYPNIYWIVCFSILTPVFSIVNSFLLKYFSWININNNILKNFFFFLKSILIVSIIANPEVTLANYVYPTWAHVIGW